MQKKIIVGNWKMNHLERDIREFFSQLEATSLGTLLEKAEAWIAPQALHLALVQSLAQTLGAIKSSQSGAKILTGAQNCAQFKNGAFTGEISPVALKDSGHDFVIIGHSERRAIYQETQETLNQKVHAALEAGLKVIYCVGETLEERKGGHAQAIVQRQLLSALQKLSLPATSGPSPILIAYEPVWAIGTGVTASPQEAQEMHFFIRETLKTCQHLEAAKTPLLYGGSVKPENIAELTSQADIDGALVGGASLNGKSFCELLKNAK
jgi:triosephosphate isomerase